MKPKTRTQKGLEIAARLVQSVHTDYDKEIQGNYKRLSRSFPVLVQTAGLGQALAFHKEKASGVGPKAKAHELLIAHINETLKETLKGSDALTYICKEETAVADYIRITRQALSAWVFFKRFAVAVLEGEENQ